MFGHSWAASRSLSVMPGTSAGRQKRDYDTKILSVNNIYLGGYFSKADNRSGEHVQRNK